MRSVVLSILLIFACTTVFAHEFFVKSGGKSGDVTPLEIYSTHYLIAGEELEPLELSEIFAISQVDKTPLKLTADEKNLIYRASPVLKNTPTIIEGHRKPILYSTTTKGGKDGGRKELEKAGFKVSKANVYEKFSKLYLNWTEKETGFSQPLGQTLEIVPLTNPYDMTSNKPITFKLLLDGTPHKGAVNLTYDGYNSKDVTAYYIKADTKADGTYTFTPDKKGTWLIQTSATVKEKTENYDEKYFASVLLFEVK